ncbi:RRQRL motif-containing zinc-binding protein [Streptomyces violaceusniger]|uniref:RRQRL motif-containing zinc-binding protein n=1 Tax=Streptomyces violaceusniger TaxID=68280 RepID=UPI00341F9C79
MLTPGHHLPLHPRPEASSRRLFVVSSDRSDADPTPDVRDVEIYPRQPSGAIPQYDRGAVPDGLATRRQLRDMNRSPGGQDPVAVLRCKVCAYRPDWSCAHPTRGWLYRVDRAKPKRTPTLAQEEALDRAMAARQTCPECRRRYQYCLPLRTLGSCLECHDGTPADPDSYIAPRNGHDLAA